MRSDLLGRKNRALDSRCPCPTNLAAEIHILARIQVAERYVDGTILAQRRARADLRNGLITYLVVVTLQIKRQQRGILVHLEHVEHVIGRREQHLLAFSQDQCLQHVNRLRDVRHTHAIAMVVEDVQRYGRNQRIAQ